MEFCNFTQPLSFVVRIRVVMLHYQFALLRKWISKTKCWHCFFPGFTWQKGLIFNRERGFDS